MLQNLKAPQYLNWKHHYHTTITKTNLVLHEILTWKPYLQGGGDN